MEGSFPPFSLLRLSSPLPLTLPTVVPCPFRHRGGRAPCLPVVCWCCPFPLSWLSAYVLFPCFFWQSSPVCQIRPDPVCAPRPVVPGLLRFPESCAPPSLPLPVVRFRPALLPRFSLYAPALICSAVMVFHSSPLVGWRTTEPPPRRLASRPSVPVCGLCAVAVLLCPWLYHGNIKADNRITAIGS